MENFITVNKPFEVLDRELPRLADILPSDVVSPLSGDDIRISIPVASVGEYQQIAESLLDRWFGVSVSQAPETEEGYISTSYIQPSRKGMLSTVIEWDREDGILSLYEIEHHTPEGKTFRFSLDASPSTRGRRYYSLQDIEKALQD